jgi:hypothetical protein
MTTKTKSKPGLSKKLKKAIDKNVYGLLDEIEITLSFKSFADVGAHKCPKSIREFSIAIEEALTTCKHPGINPIVDDLYNLFSEGDTTTVLIQKFLEKNSLFEAIPVDNSKSFINITTKVKIMWVNIETFLNNEKFLITHAEIQTPLFKQEISE